MISPRLIIIAAIITAVLVAAGFVWTTATQHEAMKNTVEATIDVADAREANAEGVKGAAEASDRHAREASRLQRELNNGREQIQTPPQDGFVGRDAMVDPRAGRRVLCRIERLRDATAEDGPACRAAAIGDQ